MKIWLLWVVLMDGGTAQVPMPPIQCMAVVAAVRAGGGYAVTLDDGREIEARIVTCLAPMDSVGVQEAGAGS